MKSDGAVPVEFLEGFDDGELTALEICRDCGGVSRNAAARTPELELCNCEVIDMTDDAVPEAIDPSDEITRPFGTGYCRNAFGQIEVASDNEPTIVERIQIITREAA
jgi:hypothetical protein